MASKKLGQLFVEYRATADQWAADLKRMSQDAKAFENVLKPAKEHALALGTGLTAVGGAVSTALFAMTKQAANYGDSLRDASIRTGVTTQQLAGLKLAAEQSGASFESINSGLKILARNAAEAASGSKAQSAVFKQLGISATDASGALRPMNDLVLDVADKFASMEDGAAKAALAQELFGRGGLELIETMNQGRAGLEEYIKTAEKYGLAMGKDATEAADKFNDTINLQKQALLGLSISVGQVLLPPLTDLVETAIEATVAFRNFAAEHPGLIRGMAGLAAVIGGSGGVLVGLAGLLKILPQLKAAFLLMVSPIGLTSAAIIGLGAAAIYFRNEVAAGILNAFAEITRSMGWFMNAAGSAANLIRKDLGEGLKAVARTTFESAEKISAMSDSFLEETGVIIGNTKAVDDWIAAQKKAAAEALNFNANLNDSADAAEKAARAYKQALETIQRAITDNNAAIRGHLQDVQDDARRWVSVMSDAYSADLANRIKSLNTILDITGKNRGQLQDGLEKQVEQNRKWIDVMSDDYSRGLDKQIKELDKAIEEQEKRAEKWRQAWSTAVGNITSKFAANITGQIFAFRNGVNKREDLEKQITSITQAQEQDRLQAVIDSTRSGTKARQQAELAMANFKKQIALAEDASRNDQLSKLKAQLAHEESLFRRFASAVKDIFIDLGESIVQILVTTAFTKIAKGLIDKVGGALGKLGGLIPGIGGSAVSAAAGTAASAAGSVGGGSGSAVSTASSFTPMGLVQAGASIVGPIVGALMTKSNLKRTEEQTRETRDWLELMATAWNPLFHKSEGWLRMIEENTRKVGPVSAIPQTAAARTGQSMYATINAPLSLSLTVNLPNATDITAMTVRDTIAPELMLVIKTNIRGYGENLAQILEDYRNGLTGSEVPVGI